MTRYVVRRLAQMPPLLILVLVLNFTLIHLAPGDPVRVLAGDHGSDAYYRDMRARFGLDRPLPEQFVRYAGHALRGDFGYSFTYGQGVFSVISERVPATLLLMVSAQLVAIGLGLALGTLAAGQGGRWSGMTIRTGAAIGYAVPVFWIGQLLILVFAFRLGWFPVFGMESAREGYTGLRRAADILHHLVLPATALSLAEVGLLVRLTDTTLRDLRGEDFVRTARAKGLPGSTVLRRHMLRNALLPVVTVIGGRTATVLTGAVLVEIVFAWPGLGRLLYQATLSRDYPLLLAMFLVSSVSVAVVNLLTDLAYALIDPRVRYG